MKTNSKNIVSALVLLSLSSTAMAQNAMTSAQQVRAVASTSVERPLNDPQKDYPGSPEKPLTEELIYRLKSLNEAGQVYEAWNILSQRKDGYAYSAARIFGSKITVERCVVESNWQIVVGEEVRQQLFMPYGQLFQSYYIEYLNREHRYPNSLDIEKMYRDADDAFNLPQSVSVDLMMNKVPTDWKRKIFFDEFSSLIGIGRAAFPKRWYDYTKLSTARVVNESITAQNLTVEEAKDLYKKAAKKIAKCMAQKLKPHGQGGNHE